MAAPSRRSPAVCRLGATLAAGVLIVAACTGSDDADEHLGAPELAGEWRRVDAYEWAQVPLGAGGFVTGISATDDGGRTIVYARTDVGGAFRWDERRERWTQMLTSESVDDAAESDASVASLAVAPTDPDVVYVAVGSDFDPGPGAAGRVLSSRDGGDTWSSSKQRWFVNGNQSFRTGGERLAVDPSDADHVVFGTQHDGLWQSFDGGATWRAVDDLAAGELNDGSGDQAGVSLVAFIDTIDGPTLLVGVTGVGVFTSVDRGSTWSSIAELVPQEVPIGASVAGDVAVVAINRADGAAAGRLLRVDGSTGAVEPLTVPQDSAMWNVAVDPASPERMVLTDDAVRDGHLWTSDDGGATWQAHDVEISSPSIPWLEATDLDTYMSAGRMAIDPNEPDRVWFAEGMAVWTTGDVAADTVTWTSRSVGIEELVVSDIAVSPEGDVFVTVADRQGFRVDPEGRYPDQTLIDDRFASGSSVAFSPSDPSVVAWIGAESNLFSVGGYGVRGAVSDDGGSTWREMSGTSEDLQGGEIAISATDPDVMVWVPSHPTDAAGFSSDASRVYVSGDAGSSWTRQSVPGESGAFHRLFWWFTRRALVADPVNGDFYLVSDDGRLFVGRDGGTDWTEAPHGPPCLVSSGCHVYGGVRAEPGAPGHLWASLGTNGLARTTDAGRTDWVQVPGIAEARALSIGAPLEGTTPTVYVYGRTTEDVDLGLWRSADLGESWELVSRFPNATLAPVNTVTADPDVPGRVYVGFAGSGAAVGQPGR